MEDTMIGYIKESPKLIKENTLNSTELTKEAVDKYCAGDFNRIAVIASGSSYNGSYGAKLFMEKLLKVKVDVITSFTFEYYETVFDKNTFIFGIGQSGRSINTNNALQKVKEAGLTAVGLTGNVDSVMKEHVDTICNWGMGIEKIGFVTKGVATLTAYLDLFALEAAYRKQIVTEQEYNSYKEELISTSSAMEKMVDAAVAWYERNEDELTDLKRVQITGYGTGYAAALEGALKIAETTGHAATGYEMEEYLHGPAIETNPDRTVIVVDSGGEPSDRAMKIFEGIHLLTPRAYLLTSRKIDDPRVLTVEADVPEYFSSLVYCIPFQIISSKDRDKWTNPMDEPRKKMNDMLGYKAPKTGNEKGL